MCHSLFPVVESQLLSSSHFSKSRKRHPFPVGQAATRGSSDGRGAAAVDGSKLDNEVRPSAVVGVSAWIVSWWEKHWLGGGGDTRQAGGRSLGKEAGNCSGARNASSVPVRHRLDPNGKTLLLLMFHRPTLEPQLQPEASPQSLQRLAPVI